MIDHIVLPSGHKVYFDAEDRKIIASRKWYLARRKSKEYAQTDSRDPLGRIFMHQLLIKAEKGHVIDHMDGNGLNNCRSNLRQCTQAQNCQNSQKKRKENIRLLKAFFLMLGEELIMRRLQQIKKFLRPVATRQKSKQPSLIILWPESITKILPY